MGRSLTQQNYKPNQEAIQAAAAGADPDWQEPLESLALADRRHVGLSLSHISPRDSAPVVTTPPQLCYAAGANYVKVSRGGCEHTGGGRRGAVTGRSQESRKRFMDLLNQVQRASYEGALFLTLTYPDGVEPAPEKVHRDIDTLAARLLRAYPKSAAIWSQEQKVRKSGAHVGKCFFHYHLIVFGVKFLEKNWVSRTWYEIVGSNDERHLQAGTKIEKLRSSKQGVSYVAKYVTKDELAETGMTVLQAALSVFPLEVVLKWWPGYVAAKTGRTWGAFNRGNLPIHLVFTLLSDLDFFNFRRLLRHYVKAKCKKRKRRIRYRSDEFSGASAWISDETAIKLLVAA